MNLFFPGSNPQNPTHTLKKDILIIPYGKGNSIIVMFSTECYSKIQTTVDSPDYKSIFKPTTYLEMKSKQFVQMSTLPVTVNQRNSKEEVCQNSYGLPRTHNPFTKNAANISCTNDTP